MATKVVTVDGCPLEEVSVLKSDVDLKLDRVDDTVPVKIPL